MLRRLILKISSSRLISKIFLKQILGLHTFLYDLISVMSVSFNGGKHPKHEILKYENWFLHHLDKEDIVLDIGSNTGNLAKHFSKKVKKVYGIEIEETHFLKSLNNKPNNVEFFNADATEFNYEKIDKVSKVTLSNVLEHIEKRTSFLKKLIDAFEDKDIKFLIRVPLITRDWLPVYKKKLNLEYRLDKTHFIEYDLETFKKEILESDLKITSLDQIFGEIFAVCEQ